MRSTKVTPTTVAILKERPYVSEYKVCPLCGGLNVCENEECFVCRWGGDFDTTPVLIRMKVDEIIERTPELWGLVSEAVETRRTFFGRMREAWDKVLLRVFGIWRRIDIRA